MPVTRDDVGLVLGVTGILLGGVACYLAFDSNLKVKGLRGESDADGDTIEQLVDEKTELQKGLGETRESVEGLRNEMRDARDRLAKLASRIDALEKK